MKHARKDYNRIQDPAVEDASLLSNGSTAIPREEPVFLLRAQDETASDVVRYWAKLNEERFGGSHATDLALAHARLMDEWPKKKQADVPDNC